jgi:hypothetical protein
VPSPEYGVKYSGEHLLTAFDSQISSHSSFSLCSFVSVMMADRYLAKLATKVDFCQHCQVFSLYRRPSSGKNVGEIGEEVCRRQDCQTVSSFKKQGLIEML